MLKFAGESANLSKNVRLIRNLWKVQRKRLPDYLIFIPLLSGWAGSIKESALFFMRALKNYCLLSDYADSKKHYTAPDHWNHFIIGVIRDFWTFQKSLLSHVSPLILEDTEKGKACRFSPQYPPPKCDSDESSSFGVFNLLPAESTFWSDDKKDLRLFFRSLQHLFQLGPILLPEDETEGIR